MQIQIIQKKISRVELGRIVAQQYGEMTKGVADLGRQIIALGGEMHADAKAVLLEDGSRQEDLWGFNLYFEHDEAPRVQYTSFINIRPRQGNRKIEIQDEGLRQQVKAVIDHWVQ